MALQAVGRFCAFTVILALASILAYIVGMDLLKYTFNIDLLAKKRRPQLKTSLAKNREPSSTTRVRHSTYAHVSRLETIPEESHT